MRVRSFEELYCFFKNFSDATVVKENYGGEMREVIYVIAADGGRLKITYRDRHFMIETIELGFCFYFDEIRLGSGVSGFIFLGRKGRVRFTLYRLNQFLGPIYLEKKQIKRSGK